MVDKEEYYLALYAKYEKTKNKKPWNMEKTDEVVGILKKNQEKKVFKHFGALTSIEKYYCSKYDLLEISGLSKIVLKSKTPTTNHNNLIYVIPIEEFYDKIDEQHKATGHGGRDKVLHNLKMKSNIPRVAVEVFLELCTVCNAKKREKRHRNSGLKIKPITSKVFLSRGHVDLVNFEYCPDGNYKWLLNYQDLSNKFIYLRPLKAKRTADVAIELLKIFLEKGFPNILQSDNERDFTAELVKELVSLWPACKILHGPLRLVDRSNQDVEQMLRNWMDENKTLNWSIGCYFVQWQKNSSYNSLIEKSSYNAMFNSDPKISLRSTNISTNVFQEPPTTNTTTTDTTIFANDDNHEIYTANIIEVKVYNPDQQIRSTGIFFNAIIELIIIFCCFTYRSNNNLYIKSNN